MLLVVQTWSGVKELSPKAYVLEPLLTTVLVSMNYGHGDLDIFRK